MDERKAWERRDEEGTRAFAAFCAYRDLGPDRSLVSAYQQHAERADAGRAPGVWHEWSSAHDWVARATAYDDFLDAERRRAREQKERQLEERRIDFRLKSQELLEHRVTRIEELLDKADKAPIVDVETTAVSVDGDIKTTKVRAIKFSGYARLAQESGRLQRQAGGVQEIPVEAKPAADAAGDAVQGPIEFKWVPPEQLPESDE